MAAAPSPPPRRAARAGRGPRISSRTLAARYGVGRRSVERAWRLVRDPLGRRLTGWIPAGSAERLVRAVRAGLLPELALRRVAKTSERLIRHWRAGQLGAVRPPALVLRRRPLAGPPDGWMFDPELVRAYCRLARRLCPALAPDLTRLLRALREALAGAALRPGGEPCRPQPAHARAARRAAIPWDRPPRRP